MASYCGFYVVIVSRSSKLQTVKQSTEVDTSALQELSHENLPQRAKPVVYSKKNYGKVKERHGLYMKTVKGFPAMEISYDSFSSHVCRLEKVVASSSNWIGHNKNGQRSTFVNHFSNENWSNLNPAEKAQHSVSACKACQKEEHYTLLKYGKSSTTTTTPESREKVVSKVIEDVNHMIQSNDDIRILASGQSISEYDRQRMNTYFESKDEAVQRTEENRLQEDATPKDHVGSLDSYEFSQDELKAYLQSVDISTVNWSQISDRFKVCNKKTGKKVANGNQVVQKFAVELGLTVTRNQRVRRAKKKLPNFNVSFVPSRPVKKISESIIDKVKTGVIDIGEEIVPKKFTEKVVGENGMVVSRDYVVSGRRYPINTIRQLETKRLLDAGVLRNTQILNYKQLEEEVIDERLRNIGEFHDEDTIEERRSKLEMYESTRSYAVWSDHSDIASHSHFLFMIHWIFDKSWCLSSEEYWEKYPRKRGTDVQSIVERPSLYMLARCGSGYDDQAAYSDIRLEDLLTVDAIMLQSNNKAVKFSDKCRFFIGDGPQRQAEIGQQQGGHYSCPCGAHAERHADLIYCYRLPHESLQEKLIFFKTSPAIIRERLFDGIRNPFDGLTKENIELVLDHLGTEEDYITGTKKDLNDKLKAEVHGRKHPPIIFGKNIAEIDPVDYRLEDYEVAYHEPLHDLTNMAKMVIDELPYHITDERLAKELKALHTASLVNKTQVKGTDARLMLVRATRILQESNAPDNIKMLLSSLHEIIHLAYSPEINRTQVSIFRLINLTFIFSHLLQKIISKPKGDVTKRRLFGSYFHAISVHAGDLFRIICLKSLAAERQERVFGEMRRLAVQTTSLRHQELIPQMLRRLKAQEMQDSGKKDSYKKQESLVSKESSRVQKIGRTVLNWQMIGQHPHLIQCHFERVADYVCLGNGVWFSVEDEGIVMKDGPFDESNEAGPSVQHFRSSSVQTIKANLGKKWEEFITKVRAKSIKLPIPIRVFKDGHQAEIIPPFGNYVKQA